MNENIYYVYVFLDQMKEGIYNYGGEYMFNYEPFYVGKGKNGRYSSHLKGKSHNKELRARIDYIKETTKTEPTIMKLYYHLSNSDAIIEERRAINIIGTKTSKRIKGPLFNKDFSNVYDNSIPNIDKETYILDHPYISSQQVFIVIYNFLAFCNRKNLNSQSLIDGKIIDGWSLTIV